MHVNVRFGLSVVLIGSVDSTALSTISCADFKHDTWASSSKTLCHSITGLSIQYDNVGKVK